MPGHDQGHRTLSAGRCCRRVGPDDHRLPAGNAERYASLATVLHTAADRTASNATRRALIGEARDLDAECMERLDALCRAAA